MLAVRGPAALGGSLDSLARDHGGSLRPDDSGAALRRRDDHHHNRGHPAQRVGDLARRAVQWLSMIK
jgi:hypothetical protein